MSNQEPLIIRSAKVADVGDIFKLIEALAEYEKLSHQVTGSPESLEKHLFGKNPYAEAIIAEWGQKKVGFALFFSNYSTFLTRPGLYIEDIFVLPNYRRRGIGKAMFTYIANLAVKRDAGRLEWSVLDWNTPAIEFYQRMGADILPDWRICRISRDKLDQ
ncbi:MAG: N-acetyltransferase family protein [Crocosphaera sp.]